MSAGNITPYSINEQFHAPFDFLDTTELNARAGMRFAVIKRRHAGFQRDEPETTGYFEGAHYLRDIDPKIRKGLGAVRWTTPVLLEVSDRAAGAKVKPPPILRPIRHSDGDPDDRREEIKLNNLGANFHVCGVPGGTVAPTPGNKTPVTTTSTAGNIAAELPGGWAGILIRTTEELSQELTWMPAWLNVLISNHRGRTRPEFSSRLADIAKREIDRERVAGLDSAMRVEEGWRDSCAVSLFWGAFAKRPDIGRGMFSETGRLFGGVTPDKVSAVAYAGASGGGPITAGAVGDKHFIGNSKDGYPINQGHLDLDAPWFKDSDRDAPPLVDNENYKPDRAAGVPWRVFLRYDPEEEHPIAGVNLARDDAFGRFKWQTKMPFFIKDPEDDDDPKKPKPKPKPDPKKPIPDPKKPTPDGIIPNPFDPSGPLAGGGVSKPIGEADPPGIPPGIPPKLSPLGPDRNPPELPPGEEFEPPDPFDDFEFPPFDPNNPPERFEPPSEPIGGALPPGVIPAPEPEEHPPWDPRGPDAVFTRSSRAIAATPGAPRGFSQGHQRLNTPNKKCIDSLLHFWIEQGTNAMALRPRHSRGADFRYKPNPDPDELAAQMNTTPIVGRFEVIGNETGMGWARTVEDGCIGRYRAGHSNGGAWYMPPELDPDILTRPNGRMPASLSDFFIGMWRANLFFGSPDVDIGGTPNGRGKNGFQIGINAPAAPATPDRLEYIYDIEGFRSEAAHLTDTGIGRFELATAAPQDRRRVKNGSGVSAILAARVTTATGYDPITGRAHVETVTGTGDAPLGVAIDAIAAGAPGDVLLSGAMDGSSIAGIGAAAVGDAVYFDATGALTLAAGSASVGYVIAPAAGMMWAKI